MGCSRCRSLGAVACYPLFLLTRALLMTSLRVKLPNVLSAVCAKIFPQPALIFIDSLNLCDDLHDFEWVEHLNNIHTFLTPVSTCR